MGWLLRCLVARFFAWLLPWFLVGLDVVEVGCFGPNFGGHAGGFPALLGTNNRENGKGNETTRSGTQQTTHLGKGTSPGKGKPHGEKKTRGKGKYQSGKAKAGACVEPMACRELLRYQKP